MRPFVIVTPRAAGADRTDGFRERLLRYLPHASVRTTEGPGHARRLAREAAEEGFDPVVAAGGDGLAHEVLNGLREARSRGSVASTDPRGAPRLGLIPRGTGNDLARSLGIPQGVADACAVIRDGGERLVDAVRMEVEGEGGGGGARFVANMAVASFAGRVARRADADAKGRFGRWAYRAAALRELVRLRAYETRLRVDGEGYEGRTYLVAVANGPCAGGGIRLVPGARPDDGLLDVLLVPDLSPPALLVAVVRLLSGRDPGEGRALRFRGREAELAVRPRLWLNADGENLGGERARFRVVPGAIRVLVPSPSTPSLRRRSAGR